MQGHDSKCQRNQTQPVCLQLRMNSEDDAAYDTSQAQDAYPRHDALYLLEVFSFAQEIVESNPKRHGQKRHEQYVLEHSPSIHVNLCPGKPKHEQRCDDGRKAGADGRHANAISHIAFAKETHDVAAHASRTAADQYDACRHEAVKVEESDQSKGYEWHDGVLCHGSNQDIYRPGEQDAEVLG